MCVFHYCCQRLVHVVGVFRYFGIGERSCPKDMELRNEPRSFGAQLAYHQTPPCNMYVVVCPCFIFILIKFIPDLFFQQIQLIVFFPQFHVEFC